MYRSIIICLSVLFACASPKTSDTEMEGQKHDSSNMKDIAMATVLSIQNPEMLDLSKDQLFIDTSRNSTFYKQIQDWTESVYDIGSYEASLKEINKDFHPVSISLNGFPSHFISLRKLDGKYILYDRCDGIDQRFEIRDSIFIYYGPLESDAESIAKLIKQEKDFLAFEVRIHPIKTGNKTSTVSIEKVDEFRYLLKYQNEGDNWERFVTTPDGISHFDLVVNHCVTQKKLEYDGFDK